MTSVRNGPDPRQEETEAAPGWIDSSARCRAPVAVRHAGSSP
jgi:hypothetical protein